MNKKRYIIVLVLLIFLGLTIFTFANPGDDTEVDGNGNSELKEESKKGEDQDLTTNVNEEDNKEDDNEDNNEVNNHGVNVNRVITLNNDTSLEDAISAVETAEKEVENNSYQTALDLVNKVTNETDKEELNNRLEEVKNGIDAKALVATLESKTNDAANKTEMDSARSYKEDENIENIVSNLTNTTVKSDLQSRLNTLSKLLDDTNNPEINIEDGAILSSETEIVIEDENEFTITLEKNGENTTEIENNTTVTDGIYTLTVVDAAFNETTISFTIDTKEPIFNVKSGTHSTESIEVIIDDLALDYVEIYNQDQMTKEIVTDSNFTLTEEATYRLTAYDTTGHKKEVWVAIDITLPIITGVENGKYYKEATVTITDKFLTEVLINGEKQEGIITTGKNNEGKELVKTITEEGTYKVVAKDKVGNITETITFTIDKTKPVITGVEDGAYYNKEVTPIVTDENFKNATLKYNGVHIKSYKVGDTLVNEGIYTLVATDLAMNKAKLVTFTIDITNPIFTGYPESGFTEEDFVINVDDFTDVEITISKRNASEDEGYPKTVENGYVISEEGSYILEAKDKAGNTTRVNLGVDKNAPVVTGVEDGKHYNTSVTPVVTDLQLAGAIRLNGEKYTSGTEITEEGTYELIATDRVGHTTKVTFTIDKTNPVMTKLQVYNKNNTSSKYVKNGDTVRVLVTFDEELKTLPTITIGNTTVNFKETSDGKGGVIYSADIMIPEDESELKEGILTYTISGYKDAAGNEGSELNENLAQMSLTYDRTAPTLPVKDDTVGTDPYYSKVSFKPQDNFAIDYYVINGTKVDLTNNKISDINYQNIKSKLVEGKNIIVLYDVAGNKLEKTFYMDWTSPEFKPEQWSITLEADKNINFVCPDMTEYVVDNLSGVKSVKLDEWWAANGSIPDQTKPGNFVCRYYSTDNAGNSVANDVHYTVVDTTAPTVTANLDEDGNKDITLEAGSEYQELGATVTDNVDSDRTMLPSEVKYYSLDMVYDKDYTKELNNSGTFVNTNKIGKYLLIYETEDAAGNVSDRSALISKRWVIVQDTKKPIVFGINKGRTYAKVNVTVKDATEVTATIDGKEYVLGTDYSVEGTHMLVVTDEAGNYTRVPFTIDTTPANVENGVANLTEDIVLVDQPFYNVIDNTAAVTINGNGKKVTQYVTSEDKFNWNGNVPLLGNMFSSSNGAKITINDLTFAGTTQTISLGHYLNYKEVGVAATYNFNTELNNVNVVGLEVVSYSAGISPAVVVYGNATLNNVNIYETKLSKLDTNPKWPVYDLAVVNYSNTTINGGRIGSIYAWAKAKLTIKSGTVVDSINVTLGTPVANIIVEEGATVNKIITSDGEMTYAEWKAANVE